MLVDVILYKTKLSTTDTMVFDGDTPEEVRANQLSFFNSLEKKTFSDKLSFNGRRSLRINGNYWLLNLDGYNYCSIKFESKTYYAFIDEFVYVNDNTVEVRVTTDYIQTYLTDIKFSPLFIAQRNYGLTNDIFDDIPYKNIYPVGALKNIEQHSISKTFIVDGVGVATLFYICVLLNATSSETSKYKAYSFNLPLNHFTLPKSVSTNNSVCAFMFPCYCIDRNTTANTNKDIKQIKRVIVDDKDVVFLSDVIDFIDLYNASIIDVFMVDTPMNGVDVTKDVSDNYVLTIDTTKANIIVSSYDDVKACVIRALNTGNTGWDTLSFDKKVKFGLFKSPYYNIYIGRDGSTQSLINPFEIDGYAIDASTLQPKKSISYSVFQEILPTYQSKIKIFNTKRKIDCIFSVDPLIDNFLFSVDKWSEYKLTHSASVGDSLSTKHAYDMEIAERNYTNQKNIANTNRTIGGVATGANALSNVAGGVVNALTGNIGGGLSQIFAGSSGAISGGVKTGLEYEQSLENATVAYENTKSTIQQERALLEIEYNNIKNSPATVNNIASSGTYVYLFDSEIKFNLLEASNIDEIVKYHKRFGFETSLQTDITTIKDAHDKDARYFDYIRTLNANVISENIPKTSADIIAKIFDSGVYLWRNYEKLGVDYLSNYQGDYDFQ